MALAIEHIQGVKYEIGGTVVFLEADVNEKLLDFYIDKDKFRQFDTRKTRNDTMEERTLVQLLKVLEADIIKVPAKCADTSIN